MTTTYYLTTTDGTTATIPYKVEILTTAGERPISFRPSTLSRKFIDLYFIPKGLLAIFNPLELTEHQEELREEIEKLFQAQKDSVEWWYADTETLATESHRTEGFG